MLMSTSIGLHVTSALGLVGTATIALAFFPPVAYVHFATGRHPLSAPTQR
jgi:hypothetical protein